MILNIKPASVFIPVIGLKVTSRRILAVYYQVMKCIECLFICCLGSRTHRNWKGFFYANISTRLFPAGLVYIDLDLTDLNSFGKTNSTPADRDVFNVLPN